MLHVATFVCKFDWVILIVDHEPHEYQGLLLKTCMHAVYITELK